MVWGANRRFQQLRQLSRVRRGLHLQRGERLGEDLPAVDDEYATGVKKRTPPAGKNAAKGKGKKAPAAK